jgi:tetratricopeptide (TPR) repeat protein
MFKAVNRCLILLSLSVLIACGGRNGTKISGDNPDLILEKAQESYKTGEYDQTLRYCQYILDNFPTTDLHIDTQLLMARTLGAQEKFEEQMDLLLRVLKENIIPERVPLIYNQIAEYYEHAARWNPGTVTSDTLDLEQAIRYYRKAISYPNSQDRNAKAIALYRTGLLNARINQIGMAKNAYTQVIEIYPESPYSTLAQTKLLDPRNTDELPLPTTTVGSESEQEKLGTQTTKGDETQIKDLISPTASDSTKLKSQTEDLEKPVYSDSTQQQ